MNDRVAVSIVNYNHIDHLGPCLQGLREQSLQPSDVIITDNASSDGSVDWLRRNAPDARLVANDLNLGYSRSHNLATRMTVADFVVALNPDVALAPSFLREVVDVASGRPGVGLICGRLWRGERGNDEKLDSTGLFPDTLRRFRDRHHGCTDYGQRLEIEPIFAGPGSAVVLRREMLEDVAPDGEFFDESFFAYCEDADLGWRARKRGWECLLVPEAQGWKIHDHTHSTRRGLADPTTRFRQLLLIRNRRLCLLKNEPFRDLARAGPLLVAYDAALEACAAACAPRTTLGWTASSARLLPEIGRKRAAAFRTATHEVRLRDWLDWDHPGLES